MQKKKMILPWLIWRIWKSRNDLCFTNYQDDAQQVVKRAVEDLKEWVAAHPKLVKIPRTVTRTNPK